MSTDEISATELDDIDFGKAKAPAGTSSSWFSRRFGIRRDDAVKKERVPGEMKSLWQMFRLAILLPIWGTLAAMILISEFLNRSGRNQQVSSTNLDKAVRAEVTGPDIVLTTRTAQI